MENKEKQSIEFRPTQQWVRSTMKQPKTCRAKQCFCLCDDWQGDYGVCVGIQPHNNTSPDIVSFCCSYYDPESGKPVGHQFLWHPQEANWIGTLLSLASVEAWGMVPQYRKLVKGLKRKHKRGIGGDSTERGKL